MPASVTEGEGVPAGPLIRPVRPGNALETTFEALLDLIKVGAFPPGERLPPERDLAARLGVSRTTLRRVLQDLQAAGFLEVRRGRYGGTIVTDAVPEAADPSPHSPAEVNGILVYRRVIETGVARVAAQSTLTAERRSALQAACRAVEEGEPAHYRRLDSRFHIALAEATGSPHLVDAAVEARSLANGLLNRIPLLPSNLENSNRQHARLLEAVLVGDAERAEALACEHLEGTESLLRGFLLGDEGREEGRPA